MIDKQDVSEEVEKIKDALLEKANKKIEEQASDSSLYLDNSEKGALDALQEKVISRKLLVFLTATGLLIGAGLDPDTWGMIAMFYIGGQSAIDAVQVWRHGK